MRAPVLPAPGVTVLAPSYALAPGGKGANAACACAVTGRGRNRIAMTSAFVDVFDVVVKFVGAVGDDAFGAMLKDAFADAGVDVTHLATRTASAARTGCASVIVDARGENQICVGAGANATVNAKEQLGGVGAGKMLRPGDVFLTQLEVPAREVWDAIAIAKEAGLTVVLNAAPAAAVPAEVLKQARDTRRLLDRERVHVIEYIRIESTPDPIVVRVVVHASQVDFLVVNEHEATAVRDGGVAPGCARPAVLCGHLDLPIEAAWQIAQEHRVVVVVTLGANGAAVALPVVASSKLGFIAGAEVRRFGVAPLRANESVIDTVGAGDAFVGAFGAFHVTLVPIRSRSRGGRRSLRTFPGGRSFLSTQVPSVSGFQPTPNLDAFRRRPEITKSPSRQPRLSRAATTSIRA
jgi:ribokinase